MKHENRLSLRGAQRRSNLGGGEAVEIASPMARNDAGNGYLRSKKIAKLDDDVAERRRPYEHILQQFDTVHGIGRRAAEEILAEIGPDVVSRFPRCPSSGFMGQDMSQQQ